LINTVGYTKQDSTLITFVTLLAFAALQPLYGLLSDKIGRKPILLSFGILGTIFTIPIFRFIESLNPTIDGILPPLLVILFALIIVSGYTSINAVVKAELFPTEIRALGVGLPYSITVAIFGGSSEFLALWLKNNGTEDYFYWYITICIAFSLFVYAFMRDTKNNSSFDKK